VVDYDNGSVSAILRIATSPPALIDTASQIRYRTGRPLARFL
jgi:hypothetical protein